MNRVNRLAEEHGLGRDDRLQILHAHELGAGLSPRKRAIEVGPSENETDDEDDLSELGIEDTAWTMTLPSSS